MGKKEETKSLPVRQEKKAITFPSLTIVALNSGNNQRLCNVLVQLACRLFSSKNSVCGQQDIGQEVYLTVSTHTHKFHTKSDLKTHQK